MAAGIDVVVHVTKQVDPAADGTARVSRFVSEIIALTPGEQVKGYAHTHIFKAHPGAEVAVPRVLPDNYRDLARFGFDLAAYQAEQDQEGGAA